MQFAVFWRCLPLNVLHELETAAARLDLVDRAGRDLVDQLAQDDAVAQQVLVRLAGQLLAQHGSDPVDNLLLLFLAASLCCRFSILLKGKTNRFLARLRIQ